ncbi:MBL fold metallo-hydrolase [Rickettsiales bacterium]|nr:MBL fold metallo-hydrolase [Rickettsiales bacterium]
MNIKYFFDQDTATFTYVISDEETRKSAIIDSALNYDQYAGVTSTKSVDLVIDYIKKNNLENQWILETHAHADHLTAAQYLKKEIGGKISIGENIVKVAEFWAPIFNNNIKIDGSDFDKLLKDEEIIKIGNLELKALYTPGHTPACCCYLVEDSIFVGDTIFQSYLGTARCDFPGGSAKDLYNSIQKIYSLPEDYQIYVGHDYPQNNKEAKADISIKEQKMGNIMLSQDTSEEDYIKARNERDKTLDVPKLLLPSIQFNLRAGSFGELEEDGINYIKIPINKIG